MREGWESRLPFHLRSASAGDCFLEMLQRLLGDMEGRRNRPVHCLLGKPHLLHPKSFAVGRGGVLFMGAAKAYVRAYRNQRWSPCLFAGICECAGHGFNIITLFNSLYVPAECSEPSHAIFCERQLCASLDRDVVVCIKDDQLFEMLVACNRSSL